MMKLNGTTIASRRAQQEREQMERDDSDEYRPTTIDLPVALALLVILCAILAGLRP